MAQWNLVNVESQLRLTGFRLAQSRERNEQASNITKRNVAKLIGQLEISTARRNVEELIQDDKLSGLIERLQSCCNLLLERSGELGQTIDFESDSPFVEAVCTLILVASRTEMKDVLCLRDILIQIYGAEFDPLVVQKYGSRISPQIIHALDRRPPPPIQVDVYMASIATEYNLSWTPPMSHQQKAHVLSELLNQGASPRTINSQELREICSRGIPPQPPWLRPRVWKLLLGTLTRHKDSWEVEAHSKRQSYYDLARSFLTRLRTLPPPTTPLSSMDTSLCNLAKSLSTLPRELDVDLVSSPLCPFDDDAPEGLRIEASGAVEQRLRLLGEQVDDFGSVNGMFGLRLAATDTHSIPTPQISVSSPVDAPTDTRQASIFHAPVVRRSHVTSLMRLVYIHTTLHPSTPTTYLASILLPLYMAMVQETESAELAHVEADTFWLLSEVWGEIGEIMEDEGSRAWMAKLSRRLAWADPELSGDLGRRGLDPTLPHYSYRWLVPLLTRTLPSSSVLTIWDVLFAQPQRTSDCNAKLEFLLDICTSMLINARVKLFDLGKPVAPSLGSRGNDGTIVDSSHVDAETEEAFIQGMALLQDYPVEEFGGAERVIEIAVELDKRRKDAERKGMGAPSLRERLRGRVWSEIVTRPTPAGPPVAESEDESDGTPSPEWPDSGAEDEGDATDRPGRTLMDKLGATVWRGITNQSSMDVPSSPLLPNEPHLPSSPVSNPVEMSSVSPTPSGALGIGNRLGNSIWRGITNQTAMETPPSPTEPPLLSPFRPDSEVFTPPSSSSSLWSFTEMFKESETAASLSTTNKTSRTWATKASTLWSRSYPSSALSSPEIPSHHLRASSLGTLSKDWSDTVPKRGSFPSHYDQEYSLPARPHFTESKYLERSSPRSVLGLSSSPTLLAKSKSALASLTGAATHRVPKSGPRPLLLSSSSLITPAKPRHPSRSPTPVASYSQPQDRLSATLMHQSDLDSEPSSSRLVPIRRGVPHCPPRSLRNEDAQTISREEPTQAVEPEFESEVVDQLSGSMGARNPERRTSSEENGGHGWSQIELPDSPSTLPSSPPPRTPTTVTNRTSLQVRGGSERQHATIASRESRDTVHLHSVDRRPGRKKSWNSVSVLPPSPRGDGSDSSTSQDNVASVRSRHAQRPTNLRLKGTGDLNSLVPESMSEVTAITPRATDFPGSRPPEHPDRPERTSRSPRPGRVLRKANLSMKDSYRSSDGDDEGYDDFLSAYESEDAAASIDA